MRVIAGYGRYDDDPAHVGCPRAKSDMTPCIARDGHLALAGEPGGKRDCVGCWAVPEALVRELAEAGYAPAVAAERGGVDRPRAGAVYDDQDAWADRLAGLVRAATGSAGPTPVGEA